MPAVTKHRFLIGHRLDCPKIGILASSLEPGPPDRRPVAQPQVGQSNRNRSLLASSVPVFTANFLDAADEAQAILLAIGPSSPRPDRGALACPSTTIWCVGFQIIHLGDSLLMRGPLDRPRLWSGGVDRRICQTFAASPAEPGELPCWFRLCGRPLWSPITMSDKSRLLFIFQRLLRGPRTSCEHAHESTCSQVHAELHPLGQFSETRSLQILC